MPKAWKKDVLPGSCASQAVGLYAATRHACRPGRDDDIDRRERAGLGGRGDLVRKDLVTDVLLYQFAIDW